MTIGTIFQLGILVKDHCNTPKSFMFTVNDLKNGVLDSHIATMKNKECFARFDSVSSKPIQPFKSAAEIWSSFTISDRCRHYLNDGTNAVILREYIYDLPGEFSCFIHDRKLRAISSTVHIEKSHLAEIISTVNLLTHYTEYDSYTADFVLMNQAVGRSLMLIEINSPVWLFATSGEFDLDVVADYTILLGEYPYIIEYPVLRYTDNVYVESLDSRQQCPSVMAAF